jgi:hypothetical protein
MKQLRPTFLLIRTAPITEFRARNPQIIALGERLLWLEWQLCSLVAHLDTNFSPIVITCMQQLHEYHRESLLLCMRKHANMALALTRMSCELARDVSRMAQDPEAEKLWLAREEEERQYKKLFRFDQFKSPMGQKLFGLYKLSSRHGVHGHMSFTDDTPIKRLVIGSKEFLGLAPDRKFVMSCFNLSLSAIEAFMYVFLTEHDQPFRNASDLEIRTGASQIVRELRSIQLPAALSQCKADAFHDDIVDFAALLEGGLA